MPRKFWNYLDLAWLLCFFGFFTFPCWVLMPELATSPLDIDIETVAFLFGFTFLSAVSLLAIYRFWHTGKLEVVCENLVSTRDVGKKLEELGYRPTTIDEFYITLTREVSRIGPTVYVFIFPHEGKMLGSAWMSGHRFERMPLVTGRAQLRTIREKLVRQGEGTCITVQ